MNVGADWPACFLSLRRFLHSRSDNSNVSVGASSSMPTVESSTTASSSSFSSLSSSFESTWMGSTPKYTHCKYAEKISGSWSSRSTGFVASVSHCGERAARKNSERWVRTLVWTVMRFCEGALPTTTSKVLSRPNLKTESAACVIMQSEKKLRILTSCALRLAGWSSRPTFPPFWPVGRCAAGVAAVEPLGSVMCWWQGGGG